MGCEKLNYICIRLILFFFVYKVCIYWKMCDFVMFSFSVTVW